MQMADMDKVLDPVGLIVVRLRLGKFVLVMRENEIDTSRVNVHLLAENGARHRRALDVPARPSFSPRRSPFRLIRLRRLPKSKIVFTLLLSSFIGLFLLSLCILNTLQLPVLELAFISLDIKVNRSIGSIGIAIRYNLLDKGNNFRNVLGNSGDIVGQFDSEFARDNSSCTSCHQRSHFPTSLRTQNTPHLLRSSC